MRALAAAVALAADRLVPARGSGARPPRSLAALTPEWLEQALAACSPGVRVRALRVLDAHSGTTARARLALELADPGAASLPGTLFAKLAPERLPQRLLLHVAGLARSEVAFYTTARRDLPVRAPECYAAVAAPRGPRFALLLEDLAPRGARFAVVGERAALDEAECVADALARLHAAFWESPRFAGDLAWLPSHESRLRSGLRWERALSRAMLGRAVRQHAAALPSDLRPDFSRASSLVADRRDHLEDLWARGPRTLVHGDCHLGNLFFEGERVGFFDWQVASRAPGVRDLSYFLCTSLASDLRREHERALLARYRRGLAAHGVVAPPAEAELFEQHRLFALYAFLAAAFTVAAGGGLQPVEVGEAGLRRAVQALVDLQSLAAV